MNTKLFLLPLPLFTFLAFSSVSALAQTLVTFDDLNETGSGSYVANPYHGLLWNSIQINNAILDTNLIAGRHPNIPGGLTGDWYGMVSPSNVAVLFGNNSIGIPNSEIDAAGTNFNFISAYFTGYWNSNLNIEVQGFRGGTLLYDTTVVVSATSPTPFTFDYLDIDRLYFNSYGGQVAFGVDGGAYVSVMDNFNFELIPEPSSLPLTALGAVSLVAFLRRKRM